MYRLSASNFNVQNIKVQPTIFYTLLPLGFHLDGLKNFCFEFTTLYYTKLFLGLKTLNNENWIHIKVLIAQETDI
jgi:hypothetical protein